MAKAKFYIIGNLTRDPIQRFTPSGRVRAFYTVACDDVEKDAEGKPHKVTSFIPVSTIGKQAENDIKFLRAGHQVKVEGKIKSWRDEANRKSGHYFNGDEVDYLGAPSGNRSQPNAAAPAQSTPPAEDDEGWIRDYMNAEAAEEARGARRSAQ